MEDLEIATDWLGIMSIALFRQFSHFFTSGSHDLDQDCKITKPPHLRSYDILTNIAKKIGIGQSRGFFLCIKNCHWVVMHPLLFGFDPNLWIRASLL